MNHQKGFINIVYTVVVVALLIGAGAYLTIRQINKPYISPTATTTPPGATTTPPTPPPPPAPGVCTADVKQCPNGTYVSRSGPNCTFAACPSSLPQPQFQLISMREGERESSFLLERIYTDRVTGLNFGEYPVAMEQGNPVTLRLGEVVSNGCTVTLTLTKIEGNVATFSKKTDSSQICPICLARNTLIDTPSGTIPVQDLEKGMAIWTLNRLGERISAIVVETTRTPVPPTHQVIHLVLNDGREVFVSGGHPVTNGQKVQDLLVGEVYDGSYVSSVESIPYREQATYDVLPSGETGFYWANGILLDSTLNHK
ncbi:MAG: hypothetical protein Q7R69_03360 [bacterium]|nr:hypothetical protein [bacterium]